MEGETETEAGPGQGALHAELAQARESLDRLVGDLRAIDGELADLSGEREQHRLLQDASRALEELAAIGGAGLFWGDRASAGGGEEHLRRARARLEGFAKRVGEIEDRRDAVLDEIQQQAEHTDLIEFAVSEAAEEEEKRRQEWIVEREIGPLPDRDLVMPWMRGGEEDERFRRSLRATLLASLLFALVVPLVELPPIVPAEMPEVPERVVRLMMESRRQPPPPRQEAAPLPAEEKQLADTTVPEAKAKPEAGPGKGPGEGPGDGPGKGILAFRDQIAGIQVNQQLARLGSQARVSMAGASRGVVERSMIVSHAPGSSGGINLAALSRGLDSGGAGGGLGAIAAVQIARATSTIAGGGGGKRAGDESLGGDASAGRTDEEIQIVFDRHKAELYRLYNRELRRDPTLRGQLVLRLTIEPDGRVSLCELKGSDMRAPEFAAEVVGRVRTFDFGAKEGIAAVSILYPIDFLPAA